MTRTYNNLTFASITPEQHARTCGYWYLVQQNHTPYTAFATLEAFYRWAGERGLSVDESKIPAKGQHSYQQISGSFREACHMDPVAFNAIEGDETRQLDNGSYTAGKITTDADGLRTVHYLNCNVKERAILNYWESDALYCGRMVGVAR